MIKIESDWSGIERELDRLSMEPSVFAGLKLDMVLQTGFAMTQAAVHIGTHSLKSSGKSKSEIDGKKKTWTGEIKYGGPSTGVNNPVDYAIYEKRRGGAHDFFAGLPGLHAAYVAAIKEILS